MSTLLEITDDLLALDQLLNEAAENGGDITAVESTITAWFAELGAQRDTKLDNYAALIRDMELRAAARKEESDRLAKRVKTDEQHVSFLKSRLKQFLESTGTKKIETARYTLSIANNGGKLPLIVDEEPERLAQEWQRRIVRTEVDGDKIRAALDAGQTLPFARYGERGTRLSIR